jgi:hypothetical protein
MRRILLCFILTCTAGLSAACVATPRIARDAAGQPVIAKSELPNVTKIQEALMTLVPAGDPAEAQRIAEVAVLTGAESAKKFGVVFGPAEHNWMVNRGLKPGGLCWQWTWDMAAALAPLKPRSFEYHWCVSDWGLRYEHNTVVVTAVDQPYYDGVTLDPWIDSGRITCEKVAGDKLFKWEQRVPPAGSAFAGQ